MSTARYRPMEARRVCPRCGHGGTSVPCWQCGYDPRKARRGRRETTMAEESYLKEMHDVWDRVTSPGPENRRDRP